MKKKKIKIQEPPDINKLAQKAMFENPCASFTECTGAVPRIPDSEEAADSYSEICDIPVTALDGSEAYEQAR